MAFQDSEGFDSSLLSDLVILFKYVLRPRYSSLHTNFSSSWRPRIPFTLLFGIATSVELLQARLLKAACQQIYGAQFDVIQTSAILETVFKAAVAASDTPVLMGASLLHSMLDRQQDQVSGIQTFAMSLKVHFAGITHGWMFANNSSTLICATSMPIPSASFLMPQLFSQSIWKPFDIQTLSRKLSRVQ